MSAGECVSPLVSNPLTFIVHVDQQLVIYTTDNNPAPVRLHNCVVADRTNWSCSMFSDQTSPHVAMKDGTYTQSNRLDTVRTVSRAKWIFYRLSN
jgi:hypothetical protein